MISSLLLLGSQIFIWNKKNRSTVTIYVTILFYTPMVPATASINSRQVYNWDLVALFICFYEKKGVILNQIIGFSYRKKHFGRVMKLFSNEIL